MDAQERRQAIAGDGEASGPVSAAVLAREHSVSRQIIVGDIACCGRGNGHRRHPQGYVLPPPPPDWCAPWPAATGPTRWRRS